MKQQRERKMWVRKLSTERRWIKHSCKTFTFLNHFYFFRIFWIISSHFEQLLSWVASSIIKCAKFRDVSAPSERLCITLQYLATGNPQVTIASCYCVSPPVMEQSKSELWYRARWGIITASNFREYCHTDIAESSKNLIINIRYR